MRNTNRKNNQLRNIELICDYNPYAEGSCLVKFGNTHVVCTASVEEKVPNWLKGQNKGWITAEYGMLPPANRVRVPRESKSPSGRTQEIQRLIGRSLRAAVDRRKLGEFTIQIDCDVLQADGGTRCASISGAWVALRDAVNGMLEKGQITEDPILTQVSAVSAGIVDGRPVLDLNYVEDSGSDTDMNVVMTGEGRFVEIQGTAEGAVFSRAELDELLRLAEKGNLEIMALQRAAFE